MTPEEARRAGEAMSPADRARFEAFVAQVCEAVARVDAAMVAQGQAMAGEVEAWLEGGAT